MSEQAGGFNVKITADTTSLKKGAAESASALDKIERGAKKTSRSTENLTKSNNELGTSFGKVAVAAFAAVGGLAAVTSSTRTIVGFDDAMLGLTATLSGTKQEMEALGSQARELGASTIYSAQQTAEAQRFLAQAGFDANEVLAATPGILSLATAGNLDLAQSADLASNVLGGFQLEVSELARVNDVLALSASNSNTNISQLGMALSYAAPLAVTAGISIEEASAAIGVLSDAGLQGSRAGTGLIGVIRQLSKITPQAAAALDKYGLSSDDVNIKTNGLESVLSKLKAANIDTSDSFAIFGTEANAAASILSASNERVAELTVELNGADGAAKRMADTMSSGISASFKGFISATQEVILVLGDQGGKSGLIGSANMATGFMRDLGVAFTDSASKADKSANGLEIIDVALRGVAVGARAAFEAIDSMVASVEFLGQALTLLATGNFSLIGDAWDDYNEKIVANTEQTKKFYESLFPSDEAVALKAANKELDDLFDKAMAAENALNKVSVAAGTDTGQGSGKSNGQDANKSDGGLSAQAENNKLLEEEFNWRKDLAVFDGEGIIEERAQRELDASEAKLEAVREYFMSDLEILNEANEARQYAIDEAHMNEQISNEEHEKLTAKIASDGANARLRLAELEKSSKINIASKMFSDLSMLISSNNKTMFELGKNASIASAGIDGARAVMSAWRSGMETSGPWAPVVAAGYAAAAALNAGDLISKISSQSFGGGGVTPSAPIAAAQPQVPQAQSSQQSAGSSAAASSGTLTVQGLSADSFISGDVVAELAEQLLDYQERGGSVVLR